MSALPPKADIGTGPYHLRRNSGSFATLAATRRPARLTAESEVAISCIFETRCVVKEGRDQMKQLPWVWFDHRTDCRIG